VDARRQGKETKPPAEPQPKPSDVPPAEGTGGVTFLHLLKGRAFGAPPGAALAAPARRAAFGRSCPGGPPPGRTRGLLEPSEGYTSSPRPPGPLRPVQPPRGAFGRLPGPWAHADRWKGPQRLATRAANALASTGSWHRSPDAFPRGVANARDLLAQRGTRGATARPLTPPERHVLKRECRFRSG